MFTVTNEFGEKATVLEEGDIRKTCTEKNCLNEFIITKGELDWLASQGFAEFKRCRECRKKRREAKNG